MLESREDAPKSENPSKSEWWVLSRCDHSVPPVCHRRVRRKCGLTRPEIGGLCQLQTGSTLVGLVALRPNQRALSERPLRSRTCGGAGLSGGPLGAA